MIVCNNCGRNLLPNSQQCHHCGNRLEEDTVSHSPRPYISLDWDYRPSYLVYAITAINIILWLIMEADGSSTDISTLIKYGAKYNILIMEGQYWRLFTSMFLHIGIAHLLFNSYALINFGRLVEKIYGKFKFLIIYIASGLIGSIASFALSPAISAGASGAIFGLMGALLFYYKKRPKLSSQIFGPNLFMVIAFNLFYGFTQSNIDNYAHIGGLVGGFLAASGLGLFYDRKINFKKFISLVLLLSLLFGGWSLAFNHGINAWYSNYKRAELLIQKEEYIEAEKHLINALKQRPNEPTIHFNLGYVYAVTGDYEKSILHFERVIQLNPNEINSYYNLALIYKSLSNSEKARYYVEELLRRDPNNQQARSLQRDLK